MLSLHGFIWERWTLRVLRLDQSDLSIQDHEPGLSTTNWENNLTAASIVDLTAQHQDFGDYLL